MVLMMAIIHASFVHMSGDMKLYNHEQRMIPLPLGRLRSHRYDIQPEMDCMNCRSHIQKQIIVSCSDSKSLKSESIAIVKFTMEKSVGVHRL